MREYRGRKIELLAPVGTFRDFEKIIDSKADAVYLGGKKFNMRMHKESHNLTDEEIKEAVEIAHEKGKKVYVTFNNMMTDSELEDAEGFLRFLEGIQVDALIVQDFGAVKLIHDLGLSLEIHLSVMANVHNKEMVAAALELGVTRVVLSREMSFATVKSIVEQYSQMEYEYFAHGDICVAHGAQCYYSGLLFGNSSNRGRCMKVCRWGFQDGNGEIAYPLAVKDLSLYQHIPELLSSGINSFKIEGRMRDSDYLVDIINLYGEAIDRYIADPLGYALDSNGFQYLEENKVRNISTAYAFKTPGAENIDLSGEREPRVFSLPKSEDSINQRMIEDVKRGFGNNDSDISFEEGFKKENPQRMDFVGKKSTEKSTRISVTVNDLEGVKAAINAGADIVYMSGESFKPARGFNKEDIKESAQYSHSQGKDVALFYALPRMTNEQKFCQIDSILPLLQEYSIGLVVSNLGQIHRYKESGLELVGDYGLNVYNAKAVEFYAGLGLRRVTLSIEATAEVISDVLARRNIHTLPQGQNRTGNDSKEDMSKSPLVEIEIIVQGAPTVMYMEHCIKGAQHGKTREDWCENYCLDEDLNLVDSRGFTRVIKADQYCKNHMILAKDLCYFPILEELAELETDVLRIEGKHYESHVLDKVVRIYGQSFKNSSS